MTLTTDAPDGVNLDILKTFGLENAPEEWEDFFEAAGEAVFSVVIRRIKVQLPEEKEQEFFRLFEQQTSDEEKKAFFASHIPNFKELLFEEIERFRKEALAADNKPSDAPPAHETK